MNCNFKAVVVLILSTLSLSAAVVIADENNKSLDSKANETKMSENLIAPRMRAKKRNIKLFKDVDKREHKLRKSLINKFILAANSSEKKYNRYRQYYRFSRNNNKYCETTVIKSGTVGRVTTTLEEKICTVE